MITTLLFDVDGVLLIGESWNKDLADAYGITNEMLRAFFRGPFLACLCGKADLKRELAPYLTRWGWSQSVEDFLDYWFQRYTLNEKLLQYIQQLSQRGIKCYLATQQEYYRATYIWHTVGFEHLFNGMFSSIAYGYMKDDPQFFEAILCELNGCSHNEILFWDDSSHNVTVARSVGIQAELYHDFASFLATMQRYV